MSKTITTLLLALALACSPTIGNTATAEDAKVATPDDFEAIGPSLNHLENDRNQLVFHLKNNSERLAATICFEIKLFNLDQEVYHSTECSARSLLPMTQETIAHTLRYVGPATRVQVIEILLLVR